MNSHNNILYNTYDMAVTNFFWSLLGTLFGIAVNNLTLFVTSKLKVTNIYLEILIQMILCSMVLSYTKHQFPYFGWTWQNVTNGLFFVSFYFGTQYKLFSNIYKINYKNINLSTINFIY